MKPLSESYYQERSAVQVARELLGKSLETSINGIRTSGLITETEAYTGIGDRASHAYGGRRTARNEMMYAKGGTSYVYLCYGIHHLFNVVVSRINDPQAVLIRSIHPKEGLPAMLARRNATTLTTNGPGTLSQALGIRIIHNGSSLVGPNICIIDRGMTAPEQHIITGPRIGVGYAGADALLPYRYRIAPSHLR